MDRMISNYLSFPGADTAARLVRYAAGSVDALYHATSFDLSILAEAEEVYRAGRRARRIAERRAHRATKH